MGPYSGSVGEYERHDDEALARVLQAQELNDGFQNISIDGKPSCKLQQSLISGIWGPSRAMLCLETTNIR